MQVVQFVRIQKLRGLNPLFRILIFFTRCMEHNTVSASSFSLLKSVASSIKEVQTRLVVMKQATRSIAIIIWQNSVAAVKQIMFSFISERNIPKTVEVRKIIKYKATHFLEYLLTSRSISDFSTRFASNPGMNNVSATMFRITVTVLAIITGLYSITSQLETY